RAPPPPMGPDPSVEPAPHSNQNSFSSTLVKSDPEGRMAAQPRAAGAVKLRVNRSCAACLTPLPPAPAAAPARCSRCISRDAHPWIPPRTSRTQHSEHFCRKVAELWHEGIATPEIGRRLGVSKNVIVGLRRTLKLPERPPRGGAIRKKLARSGAIP